MIRAQVAAAAPQDATVVRPANDASAPGEVMTQGDATTPFSLRLPAGAACTSSSAEAGYRVQSFMVPASVDPATLLFDTSGPTPNAVGAALRQPLFTVVGDPYTDAQTAKGAKNDPGFIVNVPAFSLAVFGANDVPAGAYLVGLACTKGPAGPDQIDRIWSTTITVAADRSWRTGAVADPATTNVSSLVERAAPTTAQPKSGVAPEPAAGSRAAGRNALTATPGGSPTLNVTAMDLPRRLTGEGATAMRLFAFAVVLIAIRVAFLFRPRSRSMES